jgi:hypothetical protein
VQECALPQTIRDSFGAVNRFYLIAETFTFRGSPC